MHFPFPNPFDYSQIPHIVIKHMSKTREGGERGMQNVNLILGLFLAAVVLVSTDSYGNYLSKWKRNSPELEKGILGVCVLNGIVVAATFGEGVLKTVLLFAGGTFFTWCFALLIGVKIANSIYFRKA